MRTDSRNSDTPPTCLPLFPDLPAPPRPPGVGGRRSHTPPAEGGGGYPNNCSSSGAAVGRQGAAGAGADPRIEELRQMRVRYPWIQVARRIGFDAFVVLWQTLHEHADQLDARNRITVPEFGTYLKFQRNEAIRSLSAEGMTAPQIARHLSAVYKRPISKEVVHRALRKIRE
jgi:hypothetical protein